MPGIRVYFSLLLASLCLCVWAQAPVAPDGWTLKDGKGTTLTPPNLPSNQIYQLFVSKTEPSNSTLDAFNEALWKSLIGNRKSERKPTNKAVIEGWDVRQGLGVVAEGNLPLIVEVVACERSGKRMGFYIITNSADLYKTYTDTSASVVKATLKARGGGGDSESTGSQGSDTATTSTSTTTTSNSEPAAGAVKAQTSGSKGSTASQMGVLAAQLEDTSKDPVPTFTQMARLAGFTIRQEDHTKIADPEGAVNQKLALNDFEIKTFCAMDRRGNGCRFGNLCSSFDSLLKYGKLDVKTFPLVREWLTNGLLSDSKEIRMSALLVTLLASRHSVAADTQFTADSFVDPLETLVITRVVTSEIAFAAKQKAHAAVVNGSWYARAGLLPYAKASAWGLGSSTEMALTADSHFDANLLGSVAPISAPAAADGLQGWEEDGFVGSVTTIVSYIQEHYATEGLGNAVGMANLAESIIKFIQTYAALTSSIEVEGGQPLVRTQDMAPGEEKTLVAKVRLDPKAFSDWMKQGRIVGAFLGYDLDMPQTGPLSDVQTAWEIEENGSAYKNTGIVQWKGNQNPSQVLTNGEGEARVVVEGCGQSRDLDPALIRPAMKSVIVRVTPEAKKNGDVKQDLIDSIFGAISFKDGPSVAGLVTPIMEYLYRLKWAGTSQVVLQIKDWEPNAARVNLHLNISGASSGSNSRDLMDTTQSTIIKRNLKIENLIMKVDEPFEKPSVDPQVLSQLPAAQRQQIEESMKQVNSMERNYTFTPSPKGPGLVTFDVNDVYGGKSTEDICEKSTTSSRITNVGSLYLPVGASGADSHAFECTILKSADADVAYVKLEVVTSKATETKDTEKDKLRVHSEKPTQVFLYDNIALDGVDALKGIKVKLNGSNKQKDGSFARYDGIATVAFHGGATGIAVLTIGIDMPPPKKK